MTSFTVFTNVSHNASCSISSPPLSIYTYGTFQEIKRKNGMRFRRTKTKFNESSYNYNNVNPVNLISLIYNYIL